MTLKLWADTYTPTVGQIVKIYAEPSIVEDVSIAVYNRDTNKMVAIYTIYYRTLGIRYTSIIPSMLGTHLHFVGKGKTSGDTASFNMDIQSVTYPHSLTLTANGSTSVTVNSGAIVKFEVKADNNASCNIKLYAYKSTTQIGIWNVSLKNGSGSISLVPSELGTTTTWYAVCPNNNIKSNTVTVQIKTAPQCQEGQTKCVGYNLYKCVNGNWTLTENNSKQCGYAPPTPPATGNLMYIALGVGGLLGAMLIVKRLRHG